MLNDLVMVEVAGVEPASRRGMMKMSTCLFHLQVFFVIRVANGQACFRLCILQSHRIPNAKNPARVLIDAAFALAPGQAKRRGGIMPPMRTLRSQLLF